MRKKLWRVWAWGLSAVTAGTAAASQLSLTAMAADNNQDYRRKVVGIAGIIQNVSTELDTGTIFLLSARSLCTQMCRRNIPTHPASGLRQRKTG